MHTPHLSEVVILSCTTSVAAAMSIPRKGKLVLALTPHGIGGSVGGFLTPKKRRFLMPREYTKHTNEQIMAELRSNSNLNAARAKFSHHYALIEQSMEQRATSGPIDIRGMEFDAVIAVARALGCTIELGHLAPKGDTGVVE
jgi:hypothetical protein